MATLALPLLPRLCPHLLEFTQRRGPCIVAGLLRAYVPTLTLPNFTLPTVRRGVDLLLRARCQLPWRVVASTRTPGNLVTPLIKVARDT